MCQQFLEGFDARGKRLYGHYPIVIINIFTIGSRVDDLPRRI
jgi:hypothetical protein